MTPTARSARALSSRSAGTAALAALVALLASCGDDPGSATADETPGSPSTPTAGSTSTPASSAPATQEPTGSPEPSQPSEPTEPTSSTTRPPAATLRAALVPAAQLPPLNLENRWRPNGTRPAESDPPAWVCQQASLVSNGAVRSWSRSYASAGTSTATQVVGQLADARSAQRAFGSLQANARDCADELAARGRKPLGGVQPLSALDVPGGQAGWGVVFSGPVPGDPDAGHIDAVVVVRLGDRISVVSMHSIGQDYNYPAGQSPPELTGPIVAERLAAGPAD